MPITVRRFDGTKLVTCGHESLTPLTLDFMKSVKETFSKTLSAKRVTRVEWIVNDKLRKQYNEAREAFRKAGRSTDEVILFHGTALGNVELYSILFGKTDVSSIIKDGFKIGGVAGHPATHGAANVITVFIHGV